jgi:serine/threonine protein kinase
MTLSLLRKKHVVSLLATYEHRKKFHFIFYRADGDLFKFWKDIKTLPALDYRNILWVAEQCAGIADGLSKLHRHLTFTLPRPVVGEKFPANRESNGKHVRILDPIRHVRTDSMQSNGVRVRPLSPISIWNPCHPSHLNGSKFNDNKRTLEAHETIRYGRHGDINPGNILWYSDSACERQALSGTLKLADFGEAELNSRQSRTCLRSVANTLTYRPPECDTQTRTIRQSYDIWCLACVYLELITWVLGGQELLEEFTGARKAPDIFHNNDPTDTFFEFVRDPNTHNAEVRIKPAIAKVC